MRRYFTLDEAHEQLPSVAEDIREAVSLKSQFVAAEAELQKLLTRIAVMGGTVIDREPIAAAKHQRDQTSRNLKATIERVNSYGCLLKDLDIGLLDFPTLYRGREVYLCWKLGEPGIEYWHGVSEGYQGRKKIDQDFIDHHKGDPIV